MENLILTRDKYFSYVLCAQQAWFLVEVRAWLKVAELPFLVCSLAV